MAHLQEGAAVDEVANQAVAVGGHCDEVAVLTGGGFNPNSETGMGGTGYQPVPAGYQPAELRSRPPWSRHTICRRSASRRSAGW